MREGNREGSRGNSSGRVAVRDGGGWGAMLITTFVPVVNAVRGVDFGIGQGREKERRILCEI